VLLSGWKARNLALTGVIISLSYIQHRLRWLFSLSSLCNININTRLLMGTSDQTPCFKRGSMRRKSEVTTYLSQTCERNGATSQTAGTSPKVSALHLSSVSHMPVGAARVNLLQSRTHSVFYTLVLRGTAQKAVSPRRFIERFEHTTTPPNRSGTRGYIGARSGLKRAGNQSDMHPGWHTELPHFYSVIPWIGSH